LRTRLLIIVLAGVLALAGTAAVLTYARHANERAIAGLKTEQVIAAKEAIPPRTSLGEAQREGFLTTETLPVNSVPTEAVTSTAGLNALVFNATVQPAQLLLRPMLVPATQSTAANVLSIPAGMVAVTAEMCVGEALAGYLTPGSEVMLYATVPLSTKVTVQRTCQTSHNAVPPDNASTSVVLAKVLVLSVTQAQTSDQGTSSVDSTVANSVVDPASSSSSSLSSGAVAVTFAVHPGAEADQLITAIQVDLPYLALISPPTH